MPLAIETLANVEHLQPARASRTPAIDIIVPVYKNVDLTVRCLNSLLSHIHEISDRSPRLVIINDSPGEQELRHSLASFARRHQCVTIVENEVNLGFVRSVNKGLVLACTDGRDVIIVNADTETYPDTLRNILRVADSDPQIGFVSPRSNNAAFCSLPHVYGGVIADQAEAYRRWKILSRSLPAFHYVPTAVGFYLYIKHAVVANFGYLDTEFGIGYEEENDLILRANKVGYRAVLANNAFAYHAGSASFSLLDLNLPAHRDGNLQKMARRHPEYLPLVRRYEASAHFRAERLLSNALTSPSGRVRIVFDLSNVGPNHNGTNEMSIAIINGFHDWHASKFDVSVICAVEAFKFHRLDQRAGISRHDVDLQTVEKYAIGVQLGQPFSVHTISVLEDLALINVFGMLDTIEDDCGHLSITYPLDTLWRHVASHADGLFFNSRFSEGQFVARYPEAKSLSRYPRLLPTRLTSYKKRETENSSDHVLVMGNHFAHKASDTAGELLRIAFPTIQFVVMGKQNRVAGNLRAYRAGDLSDEQMESLYNRASMVVLPSYVEGFGFGLVHALSAGKVVVARDIPATREILATYKRYSGVFLYGNDRELERAVRMAMNETRSTVDDETAAGWEEWVDGFAQFCLGLLEADDLFHRLERRIRAGDLLRKEELLGRLQSSAVTPASRPKDAANAAERGKRAITDESGRSWLPVRQIEQLLALQREEFIYSSYVTVLNRLPDSGGLLNYLVELESGVSKLEIISRLKNSPEGRGVRTPLGGYRSAVLKARLRSLLGLAGQSTTAV